MSRTKELSLESLWRIAVRNELRYQRSGTQDARQRASEMCKRMAEKPEVVLDQQEIQQELTNAVVDRMANPTRERLS